MDEFWLAFKDEELELEYDRYMQRGNGDLDDWFLKLESFLQIATAVVLKKRGELSVRAGIGIGLNVAGLGVLAIANGSGPTNRRAQRTPSALCYRFIRTVFGASSGQLARSAGSRGLTNASRAILGGQTPSRLTQMGMMSFGCRLNFRFHVLHQIFDNVVCCLVHAARSCERTIDSTSNPTFGSIEKVLGMLTSPLAMVAVSPSPTAPDRQEYDACMRFVGWIDVFVGVMVSYALWIMERRSRSDFLNTLRTGGSGREVPCVDNSGLNWHGHLWFVLVIFVITWEQSDWIPALLNMLRS